MPLKVTCRCGNVRIIEDELRGSAIECAECKNSIQIPSDRLDVPLSKSEETSETADTDTKQNKICPLCGRAIPESSIHCEYCVGGMLGDEVEAGQIDLRPSANSLQQELQSLVKDRRKNNILGFVFGLLGLLCFPAGPFFKPNNLRSIVFFIVAGLIFLSVGLYYAAKFKKRHPAWGLLGFTSLVGLIVLLVMKDKNSERIVEIKAELRTMKRFSLG